MGAEADDVVFVENASGAINAVLRSLALSKNDTFLVLSCAYAMVSNTLQWLASNNRATIITVPIQFPISSGSVVVDAVRAALQAHQRQNPHQPVRLAIFSHIVSVPSVRLPVEDLAQLCKSLGVEHVMVDGAHALGQIPINMATLAASGIDLYTGNGHKVWAFSVWSSGRRPDRRGWGDAVGCTRCECGCLRQWLYCPKGTAFLWTSKELQPTVTPTVVSSDFALNDYMRDFIYNGTGSARRVCLSSHSTLIGVRGMTGTRDYTSFAATLAAFQFREKIGGDAAIRQYMQTLAQQGGDYLQKLWKTQLACPLNMTDAIVTVQLPESATPFAPTLMADMAQDYDIQVRDAAVVSATGSRVGLLTCLIGLPSYAQVVVFQMVPPTNTSTAAAGVTASALFPGRHSGAQTAAPGSWWMRLSAQVYNDMSDFERVGAIVLSLAERPSNKA